MIVELCQRVLDGFGMPAKFALSIVVQILKGGCDIWNYSGYRALNLLECGMKVVEGLLEKMFY